MTVASYAYDSQNRRISKTVGEQTTHYIYDLNSQLIAETLADGTPVRDYFYLEGQPLAVREYQNNPGLYYFLNDHLGTPQQLVSPSGTVVWQAAYLPYGEAQIITETIHNNLRFPGQYFDAETGLQYNWNRYYDPETGRYISADPIGLAGGLNLYAYVGGNPVNWTDPEGLYRLPPNYQQNWRGRTPPWNPAQPGERPPAPWRPKPDGFENLPDLTDPNAKPLIIPMPGRLSCAEYECYDPCSGKWQKGPFFNEPGSHPSNDPLCRCIAPIFIPPGSYN